MIIKRVKKINVTFNNKKWETKNLAKKEMGKIVHTIEMASYELLRKWVGWYYKFGV